MYTGGYFFRGHSVYHYDGSDVSACKVGHFL